MTMKNRDGEGASENPETTENQEKQTMASSSTQEQDGNEEPKPRALRFDLTKFRLPQNFSNVGLVEKHNAVRLGKPSKHCFFMVDPNPSSQFQTRVLEYGDGKDLYLVAPDLCDEVSTHLKPVILRSYVTLDGVIGIWPIVIPDELRPNQWHQSALDIVTKAEERPVRMAANMAASQYECVVALNPSLRVKWPSKPFEELIREGFKQRIIETRDHPVLRALRGEV